MHKNREWHLLPFSALTASELQQEIRQICSQFETNPQLSIAEVADRLQISCKQYPERAFVVSRDIEDVRAVLGAERPGYMEQGRCDMERPKLVFMFPGAGSQHLGMGAELYCNFPAFRSEIDACAEWLQPLLDGADLRQIWYGPNSHLLNDTTILQLSLFVIECTLCDLWKSWGIEPDFMIGHSTGEYTAACVAGVFTKEQALGLLAKRGHLMKKTNPGRMLVVGLTEQQLQPYLSSEVSIAAINARCFCTVAGSEHAISRLERILLDSLVPFKRIAAEGTSHSHLMEPIVDEFIAEITKLQLRPPCIPYLSGVTGSWITPQQAQAPQYWGQHLHMTVRFAEGIAHVLQPEIVLLEVGPGQTLTTLLKREVGIQQRDHLIASMSGSEKESDEASLLYALGKLWNSGMSIDWHHIQRK